MKKAIMIIGKICSGKSTFSKELSEKLSVPVKSFGRYLRYYCEKNGIETTRESLQTTGEFLIENNPDGFLKDFLVFEYDSDSTIIIEGVRHRIIFSALNKLFDQTVSIYLDTNQKIRYNRFIARDINSKISFRNFQKIDNHPVEGEIRGLKSDCNFILKNWNNESLIKLIKGIEPKNTKI